MVVGDDYREYVRHFRGATAKAYQEHDEAFIGEVAEALKALPRIFLDLVLPRLPGLEARLRQGGRVLDVGCGGGWALVQIAERFPETSCPGIDDDALRTMPTRFAALAQWYELTWATWSTPAPGCTPSATRPGWRSPRRPPSPASTSSWPPSGSGRSAPQRWSTSAWGRPARTA
jgi:hypothetical protein